MLFKLLSLFDGCIHFRSKRFGNKKNTKKVFESRRALNLLVPTQRRTLGSHRATGGALQTLNKDCEAHSCRRVKQYRPDQRGNVFPTAETKNISVNFKCGNW